MKLFNRLKFEKIKSIEYIGEDETYDIEMENPHNRYIANDILVHNSHSTGYSYVAMWTMYLKAHYPLEFGLATLNNRVAADDLHHLFKEFKDRWKANGILLKPVNINKSKLSFSYDEKDKTVYCSFLMLKGIGKSVAEKIIKAQPFGSIKELFTKKVLNKAAYDILIKMGALDDLQNDTYGYINRRELWHLAFAYNYKLDVSKYKPTGDDSDFLNVNKLKKIDFDTTYKIIHELEIEDYDRKIKSKFEKTYLGFYAFYHPLKDKRLKEILKDYEITKIEEALDAKTQSGAELILFGSIVDFKQRESKKGSTYYTMSLEDDTGTAFCMIWDNQFLKYRKRIKDNEPIIFKCKKSIYQEKNITFPISNDEDAIIALSSIKKV